MEQALTQNISRENLGMKTGLFSALGNVLLFICKYLTGTLCGNVAVLAESFDNLMDSIQSLMVVLGFRLAGRKEDSRHPYGHGRTEYVLGLIIAITIILTGAAMLREAIQRMLQPPARSFPTLVYGVSALSILAKYGISAYTKHVNRQLESMALEACEQNEWTDIRMTLMTVGSAFLYTVSGISADGAVGIIISLLILKDGVKAFLNHYMLLLGEGISQQQLLEIQKRFDKEKDFLTLKKMDFHDYGPESRIVSLQITINQECPLDKVNQSMDRLEKELRKIGLSPAFSLSMEQIIMKDMDK